MKTLRQVKIGDTVKVKKLHGEGAVKRRIMDMGITKGVEVHIRKVAPLGDPVEVTVRGYELSLRKADADMIEVEYIQDCERGSPLFLRRSVSFNYLCAALRKTQSCEERMESAHESENCPCGQPEQRQNYAVQCFDRLQSVCWKLAGCYG